MRTHSARRRSPNYVVARMVIDIAANGLALFVVALAVDSRGDIDLRRGTSPQSAMGLSLAALSIALAGAFDFVLRSRTRHVDEIEVMSAPQLFSPYVFALVAMCVIGLSGLRSHHFSRFAVASLITLLCLIILRQILIIWENRVLSDELAAREQELTRFAFRDSLTSLFNRVALDARFTEMATVEGSTIPAALMMLDLDRFKRVNDTLGHPVGDELLRVVAERITNCVRDGDLVVRVGGDEFAILLEAQLDAAEIDAVATRVVTSLTEPITIGSRTTEVGASIGVAIATPDTDPVELVRHADLALYATKRAGGNAARIYEPSLYDAFLERMDLESQMARALKRHEFYVAYQPIFDLRSGAPAGAEALLRWSHPSGSVWPAAAFIASAEETGLIVPLGRFALTEAVGQISRWRRSLPKGENIFAAVNISPRQLLSDEFNASFASTIREAGMASGSVHFEVSESLVVEHADEAEALARLANEIGVNLSLDDFGSGYSSLSYLGRLPIASLKIDRSFIDQLGLADSETLIIEAVSKLAGALNLDVIGEGIETAEQLQRLRDLDCHYGQGYLLGLPMTAEEFEQWWIERV